MVKPNRRSNDAKMSLAPLDDLHRLTDATCEKLRARFRSTGFTSELVARADAALPGTLRAPRLPVIRFWLERQAEPGAVLARLFVFDATLAETEARAALTPEL